MTSPDGITWTIRKSGEGNYWSSVAYGDGVFVAVAFAGSNKRVMTSSCQGVIYIVGDTGTHACDNGGTIIKEASVCTAALSSLGVPKLSVHGDGDPCYKDASGNGHADGQHGNGANFICLAVQGTITTSMITSSLMSSSTSTSTSTSTPTSITTTSS